RFVSQDPRPRKLSSGEGPSSLHSTCSCGLCGAAMQEPGSTIDVTAIVESVRHKVARRAAGRPRTPPFDPHVIVDVAALRQVSALIHLPLAPRRGLAAFMMVCVRKVLRRLLLPWIVRQSEYNSTNAHAVDSLRDQTELLAYHQALTTEDLL